VARPAALAAVLGLSVAGCQVLPGDGPLMTNAKSRSTEALPFDLINLTPTNIAAYRSLAPGDQPSTAAGPGAPAKITVSPGDTLGVRIFDQDPSGTFPTIRNAGASDLGVQRVTDAGTIEVPYIGAVKAAGLTPREIEREIVGRLAGKAKNPQVIVDFVADRTNTVMVSGDVKNPGRVSLAEGTRTVVDAINRAGGLAPPPKPVPKPGEEPVDPNAQGDSSSSSDSNSDSSASGGGGGSSSTSPYAIYAGPEKPEVGGPTQREVVVRRNGNVILDKRYAELLAGGDIGVEKGDEIVVRPDYQVVTVLGAVAYAGNVPLTKPGMSLAETLGEARGLFDLRSNKTGLYIFRMGNVATDPSARPRIFRLDLMKPVSVLIAQEFVMHPRDVVYVTNAPLREYDKSLDPIYKTFAFYGLLKTTNF
jgi:polysaccharide export outer membrane protein